jgi:hypothetical protein
MQQDEKRNKALALGFARSFQTCVRTAVTFSVNHPPAAVQFQQAYDSLNVLLKQYGQFTLGFVDQRVLLNKVLTTDKNLGPLENEFGKRGIAAVGFEVGVTLADFRKAIEIVSAAPTHIMEEGGIAGYTYKREVPKVRIVPAPKGQHRTEAGDIVVETDVDSLLASRSAPKLGGLAGTDILELMLRSSGGVQQPTNYDGSPEASLALVRTSIQSSMISPDGNPKESYAVLARMLQELQPDFLLNSFPAERREQVRSLPPQQQAAEFMEDTALYWAMQQLVRAPGSSDAFIVEREVISVLLRCLKATNTAERLAYKIEELFREYHLPMGIYQRLRDELDWNQLPMRRRQDELSKLQRYNVFTARRALDLTKQLIESGIPKAAAEVVKHFMQTIADAGDTLQPEEVGWTESILMTAASISPATHHGIQILGLALESEALAPLHSAISECIVHVSQQASIYEDYHSVMLAGNALESCLSTDADAHRICCGIHLRNLLPPNSVERLIEITIERRNDPMWMKMVARLWAYGGPLSIELLLDRLEQEHDAKTRLFLVRQLGQMEDGLELVRQRLHDVRWYVVRNAALVLQEMKDPNLLEELTPLLQHGHDRVQESAFQAIVRSRRPERAVPLADSLTALRGRLLEQALDEVMFLKDPGSLFGLKKYIANLKPGVAMNKAIQTMAAIPGDDATRALNSIMIDTFQDVTVRRVALTALLRRKEALAGEMLRRFSMSSPDDPLAREAYQAQSAVR